MTATASLSRPLRKLLASGPAIFRDGNALITGAACPAELLPELEALCLPRISEEDAKAVVALLKEHAGRARYIVKEDEAVDVVAELMRAEALAFDTETAPLPHYRSPVPIAFTKAGALCKRQPTTGAAGLALDPYRSRVRLVSVFGGTKTGVVVFDLYKVSWGALAPLWTKPLVAANATFDVRRLMEEAHVAPAVVFDVLRVAALTHGLVGQSVSLASLARDLINLVLPKTLAVSDWGAEPLSRAQLLYSALDAVVTFLVHQEQEHELSRQGRQLRRLMGACVVPVCAMEQVGIPLDRDRHLAQIAEWDDRLPHLRDALDAVSGGRDLETVAGLQGHLDAVLPAEEREKWPTTPGGKLSTAKLALKLNRHLPAIAELLALREVKMLASTFGEGLLERLNPITGRLHPSFRIGSTIAGRFSCANPNIQQQPARNKAFRSIFRAPDGSSIISCDFSQIELRTLAQMVRKDLARLIGQDEETTLDEMFKTGQDIHWQTAKRMYALPDDAVKEEHELLRANAKTANFSLAFGMGLETFTKRLRGDRPEISIVEANEIRQAWLDTFYDVALWQKIHAAASRRKGYAETRLGRRWQWSWRAMDPETLPEDIPFRDDLLVGFSKPLCLNFPVQGSAGEVMLLALVSTHRALEGSSAKLIATVHDELVVECPTSVVAETEKLVTDAMTAAFVRLFPEAPVIGLVDAVSGPSWGESVGGLVDAVSGPSWGGSVGERGNRVAEQAGRDHGANGSTFFEFFAGGGMARLGFGSECNYAFANDVSATKARAYNANFGREHFLRRAIENVTIADLPPGRADCAWMSPPCVGHSAAGNKEGFNEAESKAFWPTWALIEALDAQGRAPLTVVFENVDRIKPENLRAVQDAFTRAGYRHATRLIDAAHFVPQSRKRYFVIGAHRDLGVDPEPLLEQAMLELPKRTVELSDILDLASDFREESSSVVAHCPSSDDLRQFGCFRKGGS